MRFQRDRFPKWSKPKGIKHLKPTKWGWMVSYPGGLKMGKYVDIGAFTYIQAQWQVSIGDDVEIGSHCSIYTKSTIDHKQGPVRIEDGVKIGSHTTIMPNLRIGLNSTIAAHSFVNTYIPPNEIWGGVPAKKIADKHVVNYNGGPEGAR